MTCLYSQKNCFTAIRRTKKNFPQLFGSGKNRFLAISSQINTVATIQREKKVDPAIWRLKNVVHTRQDQVKRLLHVFKVKKTVSQQLGVRKKCFPAIWMLKKLVSSYFELDKHCWSYQEREKSGSLLF